MENGPEMPKKERFPRPVVALKDVKNSEDFLKAVDFNVLNDILDKLVDKSHGSEPAKNTGFLLSPDRITFAAFENDQKSDIYGKSHVRRGVVTLFCRDPQGDSPLFPTALHLLHTLIHEGVHIRGGYRTESNQIGSRIREHKNVTFEKIGFLEATTEEPLFEEPETTCVGWSLNEAVAEEIAIEVMQEYLRRTGASALLQPESMASQAVGNATYLADRLVLVTVVTGLAERLGVSRDEIWKGIVREFMDGNTNTYELLDAISNEFEAHQPLSELVSDLAKDKALGTSGLSEYDIIAKTNAGGQMMEVIRQVDIHRTRKALGL